MPSTVFNLAIADIGYRTPTANISDLLTTPRRSPKQCYASSSTQKGENGCRTFSPYPRANSDSAAEIFPTMQQVERADRQQIARWHCFLSTSDQKLDQEIMDRIADRFMNMGGLTPGLSKKIGIAFLARAATDSATKSRRHPNHSALLNPIRISALASLLVLMLVRIPRL